MPGAAWDLQYLCKVTNVHLYYSYVTIRHNNIKRKNWVILMDGQTDRVVGTEAGRKQEAKRLLRMADKQTKLQNGEATREMVMSTPNLKAGWERERQGNQRNKHTSLQEKTVWLIPVHHLHSCSTQAIFTFMVGLSGKWFSYGCWLALDQHAYIIKSLIRK